MSQFEVSVGSSQESISQICRLMDILSDYAHERGHRVLKIDDRGRDLLSQLPAQKLVPIAKGLAAYVEIMISHKIGTSAKGEITKDEELSYVKKALDAFGLFSMDHLEDYVTKGDVIEIYSPELIQLYRNFEFMNFCNYTFAELVCHEWYVLYERPEKVTEELMGIHTKASNGTYKGPVKVGGGAHIVKERYLDNKMIFSNKVKWIIPLYSKETKQVAGTLATIEAKVMSDGEDSSSVKML